MSLSRITYFTLVIVLPVLQTKAQFYNMPGDYFFSQLTEKRLAVKDSSLHSGIKPYVPFFSQAYEQVCDSHRLYKFIKNDPGLEALFHRHMIFFEPKGEHLSLRIDPVLNLERGKDFMDTTAEKPFCNTRGIILSGYVGPKLYIETSFSENQAILPDYIYAGAQTLSVVPGQGRFKTFKTIRGYDFAFSTAFISVQIHKNINLQVGHGKHKIGPGYRSLVLSDNAFNYPYARFTHQWFKGRVQYSNIYAVLSNLNFAVTKRSLTVEGLLQKKAASFHYLSYNPVKSLQFGFFQGMIWSAGNGRNRHWTDWQYFNPIVYSNIAVYGLNHKHNIVAGGDFKWKINSRLNVYLSWMLDNWGNTAGEKQFGRQYGLNYFDAFGVKNLILQAEYNQLSENSYASPMGQPLSQTYTHFNQALGSPVKGNEFIFTGTYRHKRWLFDTKYNYQDVPLNEKPYYYNHIINARIGYLINNANNLNFSLGYIYRNQNFYNFKTFNNHITGYFYIGLRTSLYNFYYDF